MQNYAENLKVLSHCNFKVKKTFVEGLQYLGHSVAVPARHTNDLPSVQESDVGISFGISGSEVLKSASDMMLMDDNFVTILRAMV